MICIDQDTAEKNEEPFVTLTKIRRIDGRLLFGQHATHVPINPGAAVSTIKVGDVVRVLDTEESGLDSVQPPTPELIQHNHSRSSLQSEFVPTPSPPNSPKLHQQMAHKAHMVSSGDKPANHVGVKHGVIRLLKSKIWK